VRSCFSLVLIVACLGALAVPAAMARSLPPGRVVVAIVDTGVTTSKQLAPQLVQGWDFVDNDSNPADLNGHGTELASIVLAQCPDCFVMPVRVLGQGGMGTIPTVVRGIQYAAAHGANVINLSMTTSTDNPALTAAIEAAVAQGVTTVVAAGNQGVSTAYPGASATDALAVGSVTPTGDLFSWSNYGPWVDLLAPGKLSAWSLQGRSVTATGTSASAAYVSGVAGTLIGCDSTLTPSQVESRLRAELYAPAC
jgi:thermitase